MSGALSPPYRGSGWAAPSVAAPELMASFQDRVPVRLIATSRQDLRTCRVNEPLVDVVSRNKEGFDFFPVTGPSAQEQDRIVGLVELATFRQDRAPDGVVREHMHSLGEDNLIGGDASILSFIKSADQHPCRLVVSGSRIEGLVSLSDLQKLPVRAALFALITHLEIIMAAAIRRDCRETTKWKDRLSAERQSKLATKLQDAVKDDSWVDDLLFTEFADKVTIISKSGSFRESKTGFAANMRTVEKLRNHLAHANEYAANRDAAAAVCKTVRIIDAWIEHLSVWPSAKVAAGE